MSQSRVIPPLEGTVGASRGQRRELQEGQPDKLCVCAGYQAPAPRKETFQCCRRGGRPLSEHLLTHQVTYLRAAEEYNPLLLCLPEAVRFDSAQLGTGSLFFTGHPPRQKAAAGEECWQGCGRGKCWTGPLMAQGPDDALWAGFFLTFPEVTAWGMSPRTITQAPSPSS